MADSYYGPLEDQITQVHRDLNAAREELKRFYRYERSDTIEAEERMESLQRNQKSLEEELARLRRRQATGQ
jgi:septal ring factor EnvC (AmiA/AmiB activator)